MKKINTKMFSPVYRRITIHAVAARESTTDKVPIFCKCKDKCSWCSTRRCACFKAEVKCGVTCHGGDGNITASLIVQILHLLTCVRKRDYGLVMLRINKLINR